MKSEEQKIREKLESRQATNEEVLNAARFYGQQDGKLLDHPQPLSFLCWMSRFISISEILCQEVIAAYQAGYRSK